MNINALIQTERPPISQLVNGLRAGELFVDSTFQRKLVWTERQKVRLIETVLMGFPMPEIYLWQQAADAESGLQHRSVVDGQQRLTTLRQFVSNEWPLKSKYLNKENAATSYANSYWKDLANELKTRLWDYVLNVRVIPNVIDKGTIVTVFMRLNETDKSLNPQEIRNAEFNGLLIQAAEEITAMPFWAEHKIFTPAQIRRMADIEFASSMLVYLRRGSIEENSETLNEMYDLFNDEYKEKRRDLKNVEEFIAFADDLLGSSNDINEMFCKPVHVFTLFCAYEVLRAQKRLEKMTTKKISSFVREYTEKSDHPLIASYREGARARTRSKASRDARLNSFVEWMLR